ncbi:MFS transporter [Siculibacillus lacustris]|uniref:MFS transporter n=1 Tax=Siculibacillus lacustris TaxID=1549641 RepID=A0A4Q9VVK8_9HYPH|nr:MFS transporter [Siculibacillus lacustris]
MPAPAVAPPPGAATRREPVWTRRGTWAYRRIAGALFLSGYATFSLLYCVQPLLPVLAREFGVSAAESSLALSSTTVCLALAIVAASVVAERFGRKSLMFASLCSVSVLCLITATVHDWHLLVALRALQGIALGGVPAVAIAYLAEEIEPAGLGTAMGLYVGGTAFGGMAGRIVTGFVTEHADWRMALAAIGCLGLAAAVGFVALLPASRNFQRKRDTGFAYHVAIWRRHLGSPGLRLLFLTGFLVMGTFVTVYNYVGFLLTAPPYGLGQGAVGLIFLVYTFGMIASPLAGNFADRIGRGPVSIVGVLVALVGVALTLIPASLIAVIAGTALVAIGFFVCHAVASSWIGILADGDKSHAAALYLLLYYVGSSVAGSLGGVFWADAGWLGVVAFVAVLHLIELAIAVRLAAMERARLARTGRGTPDDDIPAGA